MLRFVFSYLSSFHVFSLLKVIKRSCLLCHDLTTFPKSFKTVLLFSMAASQLHKELMLYFFLFLVPRILGYPFEVKNLQF